MKKLTLLVLALLLIGVPLTFGQVKGAFVITCNVSGARVFLNNELVGYAQPTFSILLKQGQYRVKVSMAGYKDFTTSIQMTNNPLNLNVNLESVNAVSKFPLTIGGNVSGAQVYLNNAIIGRIPATALTAPGSYSLRVAAPGYQDFTSTIQMSAAPLNMNVNLMPLIVKYALAVSANVGGAQVYLNNAPVGQAPVTLTVDAGTYAIRVTAPGYQDYSTVLAVNSNTSHNAVLQSQMLQLTVNANVAGAQLYINNALAGALPFASQLMPGTYNLRATAPGYIDASATINLTRNDTVTLNLQGGMATVNITFNPAILDPQNKNALAQVKLIVDGRPVHGFSLRLPTGKHNIRISSGGLSVADDYDLVGGQTYTIEPMLGLSVK